MGGGVVGGGDGRGSEIVPTIPPCGTSDPGWTGRLVSLPPTAALITRFGSRTTTPSSRTVSLTVPTVASTRCRGPVGDGERSATDFHRAGRAAMAIRATSRLTTPPTDRNHRRAVHAGC